MTADPAARPGRLGVGVVGAGRVGAVLGSALAGAGHPVVGVSAVSQELTVTGGAAPNADAYLSATLGVHRSLTSVSHPSIRMAACVIGCRVG